MHIFYDANEFHILSMTYLRVDLMTSTISCIFLSARFAGVIHFPPPSLSFFAVNRMIFCLLLIECRIRNIQLELNKFHECWNRISFFSSTNRKSISTFFRQFLSKSDSCYFTFFIDFPREEHSSFVNILPVSNGNHFG